MAATILIGVAILSLGVYLFTYFGNYAKDVEDENRANQIAQFNSQFLSYQGKDLTIYDVITLANLAKDYNQSNDYKNNNVKGYIDVNASIIDTDVNVIGSVPPDERYLKGGSANDIAKIKQEKIGEVVTVTENGQEKENYKLKLYHCNVTIDDLTQFVSKIIIQEKKD